MNSFANAASNDDLLALVAHLHRGTLLRLTNASDLHFNGLAQGSKALQFTSKMRRRCRELDTLYGWVRKLNSAKVRDFFAEVDAEIVDRRQQSSEDAKQQQPPKEPVKEAPPKAQAAACKLATAQSSCGPKNALFPTRRQQKEEKHDEEQQPQKESAKKEEKQAEEQQQPQKESVNEAPRKAQDTDGKQVTCEVTKLTRKLCCGMPYTTLCRCPNPFAINLPAAEPASGQSSCSAGKDAVQQQQKQQRQPSASNAFGHLERTTFSSTP